MIHLICYLDGKWWWRRMLQLLVIIIPWHVGKRLALELGGWTRRRHAPVWAGIIHSIKGLNRTKVVSTSVCSLLEPSTSHISSLDLNTGFPGSSVCRLQVTRLLSFRHHMSQPHSMNFFIYTYALFVDRSKAALYCCPEQPTWGVLPGTCTLETVLHPQKSISGWVTIEQSGI